MTGASGFVGQQCLPLLGLSGLQVHAISSSSSSSLLPDAPDVIWHKADLLNPDQLVRVLNEVSPQLLLHLAWYTKPKEYWNSNKNLDWVRASLQLITTFRSCGGERAVIAGSCAEYDWRYGYCSEKLTPLQPATLYGACKHSLNLMLQAYARQCGLSTAWGRIFYMYGPNEYKDRLVPSVVQSLLKGEPAVCSSGDQVRDFLHVTDVAEAFVALLQSDLEGDINIASGVPLAVKDLALAIATQIGRPELLRFGSQPQSVTDAHLVVARTERLNAELNFSPKIGLHEGLRQTIEWWQQRTRVVAGI